MELSPHQHHVLQLLAAQGFAVVAFPMYASAVGIRRGECAALLVPAEGGQLKLQGEPCLLLNGNLAVPVTREGKKLYVWKKQSLEATLERQATLTQFHDDLVRVLGSFVASPDSRYSF
jgi:DNA-binding transcriptional regulator YbjK